MTNRQVIDDKLYAHFVLFRATNVDDCSITTTQNGLSSES